MRANLLPLLELKLKKAFKRVKGVMKNMPGRKIKHSYRAAREVNRHGAPDEAVYGALFHDYLERGGTVDKLSSIVPNPNKVVRIVTALSHDKEDDSSEGNAPLQSVRHALSSVDDEELRQFIILAKASDRLDNLKKRFKKDGKIGKNYAKKSRELLDYLDQAYEGERSYLDPLLSKARKMLP